MCSRSGCVVALSALATGCAPGPVARMAPPPRDPDPPAVEIVGCVDLPRGDRRSHNLSGLAWDPVAGRLFAISDKDRQLTVLAPRADFAAVELLPSIELAIDLAPWDAEALANAGDRFLLVANEAPPAIFSVDRTGRDAQRIELPGFRGTRENLGLEGLGYVDSAEGRYIFAVNEQALESDGPTSTPDHGTLVRILRHSLDGAADREVAYVTEPVFAAGAGGDNGVSDLAPLGSERVLVVERGYVADHGNSMRIYDVDLRGAQDVGGLVDARAAAPVAKRLVADLATISDERCSIPPRPQRRRSLDNYEGLALGPRLGDGRRLLFLVTDDNERATQVPRLLTLAVPPGGL